MRRIHAARHLPAPLDPDTCRHLQDAADSAGWLRRLQRALRQRDPALRLRLERNVAAAPESATRGTHRLPLRDPEQVVLGWLMIEHPQADAARSWTRQLRPLLSTLIRLLQVERLRTQADLADLLLDLSHVLLDQDDLDKLLAAVVAYLRRRFSLTLVTLILRAPDGRWHLRAAAGHSTHFSLRLGSVWPAQRGLTGRALRDGGTIYVPDVRVDHDYVVGHGLTLAELLIPIRRGNTVLGLLNLESPSAHSFAPAIRAVLEVLAEQIGGVLHLHLLQQQLAAANAKERALMGELTRVNARLARSNRNLDRISQTDALTGAGNRRGFNRALRAAWLQAHGTQQPLALVLADIDHFKAYNDRYGHPAGDDCLVRVVALMRAALRSHGDFFARYGGEEFAILLPATDTAHALQVAERLRLAVASAAIVNADVPGCRLTLSLGIASVVPRQRSGMAALLEQADRALYRAKQEGRNRSCRDTAADADR